MKSRRWDSGGQALVVSGLGVAAVAVGLVGATAAVAYLRQRRKRELATLTSRLQEQVGIHDTAVLSFLCISPPREERHDHSMAGPGGVGKRSRKICENLRASSFLKGMIHA